jgi:nucleoside-diphosphate-sugar epimerase
MSDGTPWRPIVHVQDVCQAMELVLRAPRELVHSQAFNIGTPAANYQVRDLADIVAEVVPNCRVEFAAGGGPDPRSYRVNFEKFGAVFPTYEPHWDARAGARELEAAFRAANLTADALTDARFIRLTRFRDLLDQGGLDASLRWRHALVEPAA